jgi:arylsulfatase A-like enzyme
MRLLLSLALLLGTAAQSGPPHVVFILADDLGGGDLGTVTPRLDRMASEGTRFGQYYSASPICSPSRTGLLTGQFPARWRITSYLQTRKGNQACEQADFLDPAAPSLPRLLKAAGYATGHFGKWHLGGGRDVVDPPKFAAYGYDEHASTWESPEPHPDVTAKAAVWSDQDKVKRGERSGFYVDRALDFLKRRSDRPCFVNLWLDDPHTPWVPRADAPKGPTPENLRAVMIELDRQVGRLLDGLKELGLDEKTLVVFTSDNGPLPAFQGQRTSGLRGSKLSLYEGGIRMPMIARWPGRVPAGRVDDETVFAAVDVLPTVCALAGVKPPAGDGEDLSAALLGKPIARKGALFWEYGRNPTAFAYPTGRDKSPNVAVRDGRWKLLVNADGTGAELYDLTADPKESTPVENPEVTKRLADRALAWRRSMDKPNLVLFITDDQGQLDSSVYGARDVKTPNMKRLAEAGMTFSHAFVASPSCAPSRASLLTGLMPARHGAHPNHAPPKPEIKKLPAYLKELGYEVAAFGKVGHYNQDKLYGFDHYDKDPSAKTVASWLAGRAAAKPLCLIVGTHQPHVPWPEETSYDPAQVAIPPAHLDTPETRAWRTRYYADVSIADRELGEIYDLAREKLGRNPLFLMASDHGGQWPFGKWNCYDAGIRVPFLAVWPDVIAPGSTSDAMLSLVDVLPTWIELAGGSPPADLDGRSIAGVLRGAKKVHRDRIFTTHTRDGNVNVYPIRSVRTRDWKYIRNLKPDAQHTTHIDKMRERDKGGYITSWEERAKTDPAAKAVVDRYYRRPAEELYDLRSDPHELRNLAADPAHAETLRTLRGELDAWMKDQGDPGE